MFLPLFIVVWRFIFQKHNLSWVVTTYVPIGVVDDTVLVVPAKQLQIALLYSLYLKIHIKCINNTQIIHALHIHMHTYINLFKALSQSKKISQGYQKNKFNPLISTTNRKDRTPNWSNSLFWMLKYNHHQNSSKKKQVSFCLFNFFGK